MDPLPRDNDILDLVGAYSLYLEPDGSARLALHPVGAFLTGQPMGAFPVDLHDLVAAAEAVFLRRRPLVRLVDDDVPVLLGLVDQRSYAPVGLVDHHHKVLILLLRDVDRVRVKAPQHRIDARPFDPVHWQRVHVRAVKLLEYGVLDLGPFPELETL